MAEMHSSVCCQVFWLGTHCILQYFGHDRYCAEALLASLQEVACYILTYSSKQNGFFSGFKEIFGSVASIRKHPVIILVHIFQRHSIFMWHSHMEVIALNQRLNHFHGKCAVAKVWDLTGPKSVTDKSWFTGVVYTESCLLHGLHSLFVLARGPSGIN